jgi:molybdopterin-containing oxidoreductase family iron-sulfur binding subunit
MASNKKYWVSTEEFKKDTSLIDNLNNKEFLEEIPVDEFLGDKETLEASDTSRRDFLKFVGFSTAAATLASCEGPVRKAIPYVVKPEDITPGMANYYATTFFDGFDFANILVKTREGRPILIQPNKEVKSDVNARVNASVLSLYDNMRLQEPKMDGKKSTWSEVDKAIVAKLKETYTTGKEVVLLTGTCASPSTHKLMIQFQEKFGKVRHVVYDAISESAALDAFEALNGVRTLPNYDFSNAETIVSIGADFLGSWQGGGYESSYANSRKPETGKMSYHAQLEANMSLTGANADLRIPLKPSDQIAALIKLYNAVSGASISTKKTSADKAISKLASKLKKSGSKGVVVTGIQDKNAQLLALAINDALGSVVVDKINTKNIRHGNDTDVSNLIVDMKAGKIGALLTYNTNPIYTLSNSVEFKNALSKVDLTVAFSSQDDETAAVMNYALATPHYLESWGDVMHQKGQYSLIQPTIKPLFNTRQFQDSLLTWMGSEQSFYEFMKTDFDGNWNQALHDGFIKKEVVAEERENFESDIDLFVAGKTLAQTKSNDLELALYTKVSMGDGQMANNPWLQELPDPITRASWDNYLTISIADAKKYGIVNTTADNGALDGDTVDVTIGKTTINDVPVYIQPGQADGSVGLALGYGRVAGVKDEMKQGVNAFVFKNTNKNVTLSAAKATHKFACVQLHHTLAGRQDILKEVTLHDYMHEDSHEWNHKHKYSLDHQEVAPEKVDLWTSYDDSTGHKFNLSIDLTACTGCAACVVACHAENNVPVVGKTEIRKSRDMHWLRIDRYYTSEVPSFEAAEKAGLSRVEKYHGVERVAANPQVAFQPVMCQHCNHAPCETVCPVQATSHGKQGQNHMAYNRCVGTRYCANNCPYRVRRFNWFRYNENAEFDYNMNDEYGKMVLNPDVVVRSRGVMEKCSLCIQMTQATILEAKKEGRTIKDGEFQTACTNACNTDALIFGDVNDKDSKVAQLAEDKRAYHLLDFVGTKPNVMYQVKVRNEEA